METQTLIDGLAEQLGVKDQTRRKWRQRGVPHHWRLPIAERASDQGVELTNADFERFRNQSAAA